SPTGTVKRVAAAVLVDYRRGVDADGGETQVALSAAELESINTLVREAIGFTESRGDSLSVLNTPFTREEMPALPEIPVWKDPQVVDTAREFGKHLGLLALGLATILMVIRPALRALRTSAPPAANRLQQVVGDDISLPTPDSMTATAASPSAEVLKLARENPGTVANVIRGWVGSEERQQR
ncbi:MAG: flagellar basal body M-ring protein FliF, partial [Gemmatimonadales bacterium]|nr:flagellar basal body M-ring protein FliF [Gemmatimonadales bacterium]